MAAHVPDQAVTPKPDYSRLTRTELALLFQLHREGFTQTQIAQRLNCNQRTVGRWLQEFADSTEPAKAYLRGSALRMAQNIVKKGLARDHVQVLRGINVLEEDRSQAGISVTINGLLLSGLTFASPASTVTQDMHRLTGDVESDNS